MIWGIEASRDQQTSPEKVQGVSIPDSVGHSVSAMYSFLFKQSFEKVENILSSWAVTERAVDCVWPTGRTLLTPEVLQQWMEVGEG